MKVNQISDVPVILTCLFDYGGGLTSGQLMGALTKSEVITLTSDVSGGASQQLSNTYSIISAACP